MCVDETQIPFTLRRPVGLSRRAALWLRRLDFDHRVSHGRHEMNFWVYMLQCADQSYYVGHTDELEKRVLQHECGESGGYTSTRRPVRVIFTQEFASREEALAAERQIKRWSRKKKEALVRGDWAEMSRLAQRRKPFR